MENIKMKNKCLLFVIFAFSLQAFLFAKVDYETEKKAIDEVVAGFAFEDGELYVCTKEEVDSVFLTNVTRIYL